MFQTLFGIPAEVVIGWAITLFIPGAVLTLLLTIVVQLWRRGRENAYIAYMVGTRPAPRRRRGTVVEGPWRSSSRPTSRHEEEGRSG